jgi:glycerate kinase
MRVLIAPDKFKGALSAREVAENIALGIREADAKFEIDIVPMADGGEGTAEVICDVLGGAWMRCKAHDALGRQIDARYAWIEENSLAVMEMSEAAGTWRLTPNDRDIERASTFGVGEMILDAAKRGAREIIVGLGGSATNDGGFGLARALAFRFFTPDRELDRRSPSSSGEAFRVDDLLDLHRIESPPNLKLPNIVAAADVRNPLLGENGATSVFGPQKGGAPEEIEKLERALTTLADVVAREFGVDYRNQPAAGAAGGLGFGLMTFCRAQVRSGFEIVAETIGFETRIREADVVITGEGSLDRQTLAGKTAFGVAQLARKNRKRIVAVVGRAADDSEPAKLFDQVCVVSDPQVSEKQNISRAAELLRAAGYKLGKAFKVSPV